MSKHPEFKEEEVVDRLIKEIRQKDIVLLKIEELLRGNDQTRELTTVGAIKYLFRELHEAKEQIRLLSKELDRTVKKSK